MVLIAFLVEQDTEDNSLDNMMVGTIFACHWKTTEAQICVTQNKFHLET